MTDSNLPTSKPARRLRHTWTADEDAQLLHLLKTCSYRQVARMMNITPGMVSGRVGTLRQSRRELMGDSKPAVAPITLPKVPR